MPNIENLKKQAKQYLRWHRERYYPVAAQIRAALPRFRNLGDVQILGSSFRLADAQELVARQMGFDGWQALKSGADAMKLSHICQSRFGELLETRFDCRSHPRRFWNFAVYEIAS